MLKKRIIPVLLLNNDELIHRCKFNELSDRYIGDPINTINIFNQYQVDEIIILDISSSIKKKINFDLLESLSGEAFFPMTYGGGIKNLEDAEKIINLGFEKIIINNKNFDNFDLLTQCKKKIGAQSLIAAIDIIKNDNEYFIYDYTKKKKIDIDLNKFLISLKELEIGEICLTSVDNDGSMIGCDFELIKRFEKLINIPIIYKGGAKNYNDIKQVFSTKVSGFASSTIFIMKKINGGIVLNYPSETEKEKLYDRV